LADYVCFIGGISTANTSRWMVSFVLPHLYPTLIPNSTHCLYTSLLFACQRSVHGSHRHGSILVQQAGASNSSLLGNSVFRGVFSKAKQTPRNSNLPKIVPFDSSST